MAMDCSSWYVPGGLSLPRGPVPALHLYVCPWVGDGAGRSREQARKDERWCEAVARFVSLEMVRAGERG